MRINVSSHNVVFKCYLCESICYVLIFCGVVLSDGVSSWYVYVLYVYVFRLIEMNLCSLQFGFLHANAGWHVFGRACYVVFYQWDETSSCFVALSWVSVV